MKILLSAFLLLACIPSGVAQVIIHGKVSDDSGKPLALVNVYLKDVFDGAVTNDEGVFTFSTKTIGKAVLLYSAVGYSTFSKEVEVLGDSIKVDATMKVETKFLGEVVISAGAFEVSDKKRAVVLKPLDIVTTAGAAGDIFGALQTLPGVAPANNETGLFVRGGAAHEAKTIVDGMIVTNPFFGDVPDVPQRARFSPFGFSGMVFSTGGYSAEFGQALSSVLVLNSNNDLADNARSINLGASGISLSASKKIRKESSILGEINYTNLKPLYSIIPQNREWIQPPESFGTTMAFLNKKDDNNWLRSQIRWQHNSVELIVPDLSIAGGKNLFQNRASNFTFSTSLKRKLKQNWNFISGVSAQYDNQSRKIGTDILPQKEFFLQVRAAANKRINKIFTIKAGTEVQYQEFKGAFNQLRNSYKQVYVAGFGETDIKLSSRLLAKAGVRPEFSSLNDQFYLSPRFAMAFKTGVKSQISVAYGHYYQNPENQVYARNNSLLFEKATHYILNYQLLSETYTFRIELYNKVYQRLVTYNLNNGNLTSINNGGNGFAQGIDLFWRDNKGSIKNFDYWVSYGFLFSERIFRNYNFFAVPNFAPRHTLNIVAKYELPKIRSRIGSTFTYSTERSFYNPVSFVKYRTDAFRNLSCSFSHITSLWGSFTVFFVSVNNVLNIKNVLNFRFSNDGLQAIEVNPPVFRSYFAGITMRF